LGGTHEGERKKNKNRLLLDFDFLCDPVHKKIKVVFPVMQRMHGLVFIVENNGTEARHGLQQRRWLR
jgi:hypothetical protein